MATQAERRESTRAKLLDAAMACLVTSGYRELTTTAVAKRAGVSQGALFKHFATKQQLLAATVEHLFAVLRAEYDARFAAFAAVQEPTVAAALELLTESMSDPRYLAALELLTAARTDPELQASLGPVVSAHGEHLRQLAHQLPIEFGGFRRETLDDLITLATLSLQGAAVNQLARPDADDRAKARRALINLAGLHADDRLR